MLEELQVGSPSEHEHLVGLYVRTLLKDRSISQNIVVEPNREYILCGTGEIYVGRRDLRRIQIAIYCDGAKW